MKKKWSTVAIFATDLGPPSVHPRHSETAFRERFPCWDCLSLSLSLSLSLFLSSKFGPAGQHVSKPVNTFSKFGAVSATRAEQCAGRAAHRGGARARSAWRMQLGDSRCRTGRGSRAAPWANWRRSAPRDNSPGFCFFFGNLAGAPHAFKNSSLTQKKALYEPTFFTSLKKEETILPLFG